MRIHVKFFAVLRDKAGVPAVDLDLQDGATCADACRELQSRYPEIAAMLQRTACAVDKEYVPLNTVLQQGQELALIPPVSGG